MTYQPLRVLSITIPADTVKQMDRTITTSTTDNGLDAIILQCPHDIGCTFIGCASIHICIQAAGIRPDNGLQAPALDNSCGLDKNSLVDPVGRRHQCDLISRY